MASSQATSIVREVFVKVVLCLPAYLFVIRMQVLSKLLDKAAADKKIGYHPYCQDLSLTHLCFADDLLVFADGRKESVEGILAVFKDFAEMSGLRISMEKSTLYLAGVMDSDREVTLNHFPLDSGALPVRYLGLPLMSKQMGAHDYRPLTEKIRNRVRSWTARSLSFAGRSQLIGSVIHSLTNFRTSAFRLPKKCIDEIDSICAAFLWSGPDLNPRKAKVSWKDVCKPKEEGGLGLRSISEVNNVCCLKLIWRILSSKTSLWVRWIRRYLIRKGSFWTVNEKSSLGSWMWKKVLKHRTTAATFFRREVQSGSSTSFWHDSWCDHGKLIELAGERGRIAMGISLHATVEYVMQTHRRRRHRVDNLNIIECEIQALRTRGLTSYDDISLWRGKGDNFCTKFRSKVTWGHIRVSQPRKEWYQGIWFHHATPKFSFLAWLAVQNRLATGERVKQWNVNADAVCGLCKISTETWDHLFFECSYSACVWSDLSQRSLANKFSLSWNTVIQLLVATSFDKTQLLLVRYIFQTTVYYLWRERNGRLHGEASIPTCQLIRNIDKQIRNRIVSIRALGDDNAMETWLASRPP